MVVRLVRSWSLLCVCACARRVVPSTWWPANGTLEEEAWAFDDELARDRRLSSHSSHATDASAHLVTSLPGLPRSFSSKQWAGLLPVEDGGADGPGALFYWLFEADNGTHRKSKDGKAPLIIWMNGGPGCSSMDGLFIENGPFRLKGKSTQSIEVNPHSWHKLGHAVYIDQPIGTGLSAARSGRYCKNDACINRHLYFFLQRFVALHSKLLVTTASDGSRVTVPIYMTGESHAGHYVVSFADFLQQRDGPRADEVRLDLRGIALGNAWIDPYHQYDVSRYAHARGLITEGQVHSLRHAERACQRKLDAKQWYSKQCWDLLDTVIDDSGQKGRARVSMYDSRNFPKSASDFPPGHLDIERYMSTKAVRDALHANRGSPGGGSVPSKFKECTDPPYMALQHQDGLGVMRELARVLEKGEVDVLFYNGQYDVICNHLSSEKALGMLEWSGSKKYRAAPHTVWWSDTRKGGGPAGYAKASGPLTLLLVNDAGHMVPLDLPEIALEMVSRLISRRGFADQQQKIPDDGKGGAIASDCSRAEPEARALGEAGPSNATDNDDDLADAAPQGLSTSDEILWLRAENLRLRQALEVQVDSTGQ